MSSYSGKEGFNQTFVSLIRMNPQPTSLGIQVARRVPMGDGSILDQGLYTEWNYNVIEDSAQLIQILTPLGLHTAKFRNVTIYTRDDLYVYHRYNAVAHRPFSSWENYFARSVVIKFVNLEFIA